MRKESVSLYWQKNPEWYRFNEALDRYELTDKAPKEARDSFEIYMMPRAEREKRRIGL